MPSPPAIELSVIAPAHNEEDNVDPLVAEIVAALSPHVDDFEIIVVDDGSTDGTLAALESIGARTPQLRVLTMRNTPPGRGHGQSAAFAAAIRAARGDKIAMLDADLQNDPADLPVMLDLMRETNADMIQGDRSHARRDTFLRRISSAVGRSARAIILADSIRDTGCSLRVLKRSYAERLPLEFRGAHRFIPITVRQIGGRVVETPVRHRARVAGEAKYGVWNRAIPGLIDCFAIRWMGARRRPTVAREHADPPVVEVTRATPAVPAAAEEAT